MKGRRIASIAFALVAAAVVFSCDHDSPTAPAPTNPPASNPPTVASPVNINGVWDWTETSSGCTNTGSYAFSQSGSTFAGIFGQAGNDCSGFSEDFEGAVTDGVVNGGRISFRASRSGTSCSYTAVVSGNPPSSIDGTGSCGGSSITWRATRAAPVASISIEPAAATVVVNWTRGLRTVLRSATGDRLFQRPIAWSSDNEGVATATAAGQATSGIGVVRGVGAGTATITATVEEKTAQATVTALSIESLRIAFESPRGVEVMAEDGSGRTGLTRAGVLEPTSSADGTTMAVTVMSGISSHWWDMCAIYTVRGDGSDERHLTSSAECDHAPAWSPDGTKIAFARGDPGCFSYCRVSIHVTDANGSNTRELAGSGTGWDTRPTWSPDGKKLAFESYNFATDRYDIYAMNADGTDVVELTSYAGFNTEPTWAPDGSLAFVRDGDIWLMNADGSGARNLTPNLGFESNPSWSPNGEQVVFVSAPASSCWYPDPPCRHSGSDLYVINRDGTGLRRLTTTEEYEANPTWLPAAPPSATPRVAGEALRYFDSTLPPSSRSTTAQTRSTSGRRTAFGSPRSKLRGSK